MFSIYYGIEPQYRFWSMEETLMQNQVNSDNEKQCELLFSTTCYRNTAALSRLNSQIK